MRQTKLNKTIFFAIILYPSIIYRVYESHILSNPWISIFGIISIIFIFLILMTALMQLTVSFDWLYSKKISIISLKPLYLIYTDPDNYRINPSYKERVVHTLLGFGFFLLGFANLYQYLSWMQDVQSFNIPSLSFSNALYFATVTSATVGYGDIVPKSTEAKVAVTAQIWITFIYVLGILSSLPSILHKLEDKED